MVTQSNTAVADPALSGLPRANVRQPGDFPEDEFVLIPNVPVFAEHTTTAKDGRQLRFGLAELQAVADRCNQRIQESGDYAAICFGHTPSPDEDKEMPELCGYAGPFRIGTLGANNRPAILADFHILREDLPRFKKHPRRSPEVWLEDSYEEMFLDPIALLSSECPRLDMGLLYSARKNGRLVEKYTAVAPAAGNVFAPKFGTDRDEYAANSPTDSGVENMPSLTSEDVRAIIDAFMKTDVMMEVQQLLAERQGPNASEPPGLGAAGPPTATPMDSVPPPLAAPPAEVPPSLGPEPGGPEPPAAPPAPAPEPPEPPGPPEPSGPPEPPAAPSEDEEPKKFAANETGEYQDATAAEISSGETVDHDLGSPRKYGAEELDELDDDEFEEYKRQRAARRKRKYEAGSVDETSDSALSGTASVEPDNPGPTGEGSVGNAGEATGEYQETDAEEVVKFSRHKAQANAQVEQLRKDMGSLKYKLDQERGKRINAERMTALAQRAEFYNLDPDEEMEVCKYGRMSADQFNDHLLRIEQRYQRRPIAAIHRLPTHTEGSTAAAAAAPDRPGNVRAKQKFSKQHSDVAFKIGVRRAMAGEDVSYPEILEQVAAGTLKDE